MLGQRTACRPAPFERDQPAAGAIAPDLTPLVEAIRAHVFAAERIHADDTTVPVLAKGKTRASQARHENFSRTCWITFYWRGMSSN